MRDYLRRFRRTLLRLILEVRTARHVAAAILATEGEESSNLFIQAAVPALQADLQIRLIRILEDNRDTSSFWYLHRCDPAKVAADIDVSALRNLSVRLKKVRNKVFVHIDKDAVFDPEAIYQEVDIKWREIADGLESLWQVLNRLYEEHEGKKFEPVTVTFSSLCQDFKRDFSRLKI